MGFKGELFDKVDVNGDNEHPLFALLKKALPAPHDDTESLMSNPHFFIWKPVKGLTSPGTSRSSSSGRTGLLSSVTPVTSSPRTSRRTSRTSFSDGPRAGDCSPMKEGSTLSYRDLSG